MPLNTRVLASTMAVVGGVATIALAAPSSADPDIDGESAAAVIDELQEQGYSVMVNGDLNPNAVWYYPEPSDAAKEIKGRVAFWKGVLVS